MVALTRLGPSGTPAKPYGTFTHVAPSLGRTYTETFTRLGMSGTPRKPFGSFAGKAGATQSDISASLSVVPILNMEAVTDVDLDFGMYLLPVATMSSSVSLPVSNAQSVVPVLTQARSSTSIFGTFPKDATASVVPVLTMSVALNKSLPISMSAVPALSMASTVDATFVEKSGLAQSVVPVLTQASVVNITNNDKAVNMSAIPVLTMTVNLNKVEARVDFAIDLTACVALDMTPTVKTGGEVDRIRISSTPIGHIRITKI